MPKMITSSKEYITLNTEILESRIKQLETNDALRLEVEQHLTKLLEIEIKKRKTLEKRVTELENKLTKLIEEKEG
jgi:hypothetical protein